MTFTDHVHDPRVRIAVPGGRLPRGVRGDAASAAAAETNIAANVAFMLNIPAKQTTADQDQLGVHPDQS
jgi:hypothetical protein